MSSCSNVGAMLWNLGKNYSKLGFYHRTFVQIPKYHPTVTNMVSLPSHVKSDRHITAVLTGPCFFQVSPPDWPIDGRQGGG